MTFEGPEYAKATITENFKDVIQKVVDSSRGYAIKLSSDDGRSMWVGIGFHDRNDAFDFYAAFEDFQKKREMERNPHLFKNLSKKQIDFSLKPGQVINLNIAAGTAGTQPTGSEIAWENPFDRKSQQQASTGFSDGFDFNIPAPDKSNGGTGGFDENNWGMSSPSRKVDLLSDQVKGPQQTSGGVQANGGFGFGQGNAAGADPWFGNGHVQGSYSGSAGHQHLIQPSVQQQKPKNDDFLDLLG